MASDGLSGAVQVTDFVEPEHDPNKHCYVCKKVPRH